MTHPGIFAILVGVAIGTAIYYYFNSENYQQPLHYASGEPPVNNGNYRRNSSNNNLNSPASVQVLRRRGKNSSNERCKDNNEKCTICLETIPVDVSSRVIVECGHEFHTNCLTLWLREKKDCPVCRAPVL